MDAFDKLERLHLLLRSIHSDLIKLNWIVDFARKQYIDTLLHYEESDRDNQAPKEDEVVQRVLSHLQPSNLDQLQRDLNRVKNKVSKIRKFLK